MTAILIVAGLLGALAAWAVHRHTEGRPAPFLRPDSTVYYRARYEPKDAPPDDGWAGGYTPDDQLRDSLNIVLLSSAGDS